MIVVMKVIVETRYALSLPSNLSENLYVTNQDRFAQRIQFIWPCWCKFLTNKPFVPSGHKCFHNGRIIKFLCIIQFMPSGYATCMDMSDVFDVLFDRVDYIAFHDLHVEDIVKQLEPLRSNHFAKGCAPGCFIALIIGMPIAVQQFHDDGNAMFFGQGHQFP